MSERRFRAARFLLQVAEACWFYARGIGRKLIDDDILFLASGLAFNGILTLIPLMLLAASALGAFLESSDLAMERLNDFLEALFPEQPFATSIKTSILAAVADIVSNRRSIGLFGALVLVYTATSLFDAIRSILHNIFRLKKQRSLMRSLVHHVGFVFLAFVLFMISSVTVWALSVVHGMIANIPALGAVAVPELNKGLTTTLVTLLTTVMFYIIYRYIPDVQPPRAAALIATITTTILWVVSGQLFAIYLSRFSAIGTIYGPYAFILVLLIWIYYSCLVFVIGGIVGQVYWERLKLKESGKLERWI